jgi:hypothetical protein
VPRDLGLRGTEDLDEIADTDLLVTHQVEQPEPGFVTQRLKKPFQIELRFRRHDNIFALTNLSVKDIVALTDMFGEEICQRTFWIR